MAKWISIVTIYWMAILHPFHFKTGAQLPLAAISGIPWAVGSGIITLNHAYKFYKWTPDRFRWQLQVLALTCAAYWKNTLSPRETAQTGDLVELVESMLGVHIIVWNVEIEYSQFLCRHLMTGCIWMKILWHFKGFAKGVTINQVRSHQNQQKNDSYNYFHSNKHLWTSSL